MSIAGCSEWVPLWVERLLPKTLRINLGLEDIKSTDQKQTEEYDKPDTFLYAIHNNKKDEVAKYLRRKATAAELLNKRDSNGATPLHWAVLTDQVQVYEYIINRFPERVIDRYEVGGKDLYTGETCLHIAVVKDDLELMKKLLRLEPELINLTAYGFFFQHTVYYGEYPLSFAVCRGNEEMVRCVDGGVHASD